MLTTDDIRALINAGRENDFYTSPVWRTVRDKVLRLDNYECQICRAKGRYSRADIVHHVKHLKDRPDLALEVYDGDARQLISVCKKCHDDLHLKAFARAKRKPDITAERWD